MMEVKNIFTRYLLLILFFTGMKEIAIAQHKEMDFWVPYPSNAAGNMQVYISTDDQPANVTITISADNLLQVKDYQVKANSTLQSGNISGSVMLGGEGLYNKRFVHIHSDVPVSAVAHLYGSARAGATILSPVDTWGYSYVSMDSPWDENGFTCIMAAFDNTKVEIVPRVNSETGHPAGQPFTIVLNKGQLYQLNTADGEITGATVKSRPNSDGVCYPVAVFSGSAFAFIHATKPTIDGSSDPIIQQLPPTQSWGRTFLTAPFSTTLSLTGNSFNPAMFRVMVKDPSTVVKRNGVVLTGLMDNLYYQFISSTADYIEADGPVMLIQFMFARSETTLFKGWGDAEMIVLSPLDKAVKRSDFYLTYNYEIVYNYLTLIIPTMGLASLTIDGSNNFSYVYPHPNLPGYSVVVKTWVAAGKHCTVKSDSSFTAITYGLFEYESYGYNIIPQRSPDGIIAIANKNDNSVLKDSMCAGSAFQFVLKTEYTPQSIEWNLNGIPGLSPNNKNVVLQNPVPDSVITSTEGRRYNVYALPQYDTFNIAGKHTITVTVTTPLIENCSHSETFKGIITVKPTPLAAFTLPGNVCMPGGTATFTNQSVNTPSGTDDLNYRWDLGDLTLSTEKDPVHRYATANIYNVSLITTGLNGCSDTATQVFKAFANKPTAGFDVAETEVCQGEKIIITDKATAGAGSSIKTWNWELGDEKTASTQNVEKLYDEPGTYAITQLVTSAEGCTDNITHSVTIVETPFVDAGQSRSIFEGDSVRLEGLVRSGAPVEIKWSPAADLSAANVQNPVARPKQPQWYYLMATVAGKCSAYDSTEIKFIPTLSVPNGFTPNGDGVNDKWGIPGLINYTTATVQVFNRWGQKIFESTGYSRPWDGTFKNNPVPAGTYFYIIDPKRRPRMTGSVTVIR